ncbi:MAG TPA: vitamin K epoxide reductase family protein [Solirubrobacterales bacterium]|nr:vitamin K epoxide reductase family protein [Solirubrobacterales bacterium]
MSDQIHLLRHGIPTEIAVAMLVVAIAVIGAVLYATYRQAEGGERTLRITAGALCVIGLAIAGFVAYKTVILNELPPCVAGSSGCAIVENSDYSHLFGIHVSIYGIIGYALILGATIMQGDRARLVAFVLSLFGFGFSLYLTYLELWEILAICQWCVGSAVGMTLLFIVNTTRVVSYYGLDEPAETND